MPDERDAARKPPQNLDAEELVLGAMMLSDVAIDAATEGLSARDFYRASHGRIFDTCVALHNDGKPVDVVTVANALDERGDLETIGGAARLQEIASLVPAVGNVRSYVEIVAETAALRNLTVVGEQISRLGWERPGPVRELVERAEQMMFDLSQGRTAGDFVPFPKAVDETVARLIELNEGGRDTVGIPTGFDHLDRMTSGLQPGNVIVVAGRPSMGKSALGIGLAANTALRQELPVAIFTLEMSRHEVIQRLLQSEALVESEKLRNGRMARDEWQRVMDMSARLARAPIHVDDNRLTNPMEIRSKCRRLKLRYPNLALVVVDYIQLMGSGGNAENRVQEVAQISRSLKILAGDLNVPVVALSQLSRALETRHDRRPILSDLRESGAIEQDADLVIGLYRDEVYNAEDTDQQGVAELILLKHRNGPIGTVRTAFVKRYARFSELPRPGAGDVR